MLHAIRLSAQPRHRSETQQSCKGCRSFAHVMVANWQTLAEFALSRVCPDYTFKSLFRRNQLLGIISLLAVLVGRRPETLGTPGTVRRIGTAMSKHTPTVAAIALCRTRQTTEEDSEGFLLIVTQAILRSMPILAVPIEAPEPQSVSFSRQKDSQDIDLPASYIRMAEALLIVHGPYFMKRSRVLRLGGRRIHSEAFCVIEQRLDISHG